MGGVVTVSVQARLTTDDLVAALEQLDPAEAEEVSRRLQYIQARRKAANLTKRESELLAAIYAEKRAGFRERFDALTAKRRAHALTAEEQEELVRLTEEAEAFDARRLAALVDLAQVRQLSLPDLMQQLGLTAPTIV